MDATAPNIDTDQADIAEDGSLEADTAGRSVERDPRETSHPTGEKQAAENADNESAG
jgi:hypothetical protein